MHARALSCEHLAVECGAKVAEPIAPGLLRRSPALAPCIFLALFKFGDHRFEAADGGFAVFDRKNSRVAIRVGHVVDPSVRHAMCATIRSGESGSVLHGTLKGDSASAMALTSAGGATMAPPSPMPFMPPEVLDGVMM